MVLAVAFALLIGVPLGLISGYIGGNLDRALVLIGRGVMTAALAITVTYVPQYFRIVRNHVSSVREEPYVEAARALGAKRRTIIGRYVFSNVIQSVPPIATLNAADAILTLAALGFLGYGIQPTEAGRVGR